MPARARPVPIPGGLPTWHAWLAPLDHRAVRADVVALPASARAPFARAVTLGQLRQAEEARDAGLPPAAVLDRLLANLRSLDAALEGADAPPVRIIPTEA